MPATEAREQLVSAILERADNSHIVFHSEQRTGVATGDLISFDDFRPSAAEMCAWKDAVGATRRLTLAADLTARISFREMADGGLSAVVRLIRPHLTERKIVFGEPFGFSNRNIDLQLRRLLGAIDSDD